MSLRRVDIRFALSEPVQRALVLGGLPGWREGVEAAGGDAAAVDPTLVVAPSSHIEEAIAQRVPSAVIEGRGSAPRLRQAYAHVARFLPAPTLDSPELLLPLDDPRPGVYVARNVLPATPVWKAVRNRVVGAMLSRGAFPEVRPVLTVGQQTQAPPFLVAAAEPLGVPRDAAWFLTLGRGDALTRAVFHLFPPGEAEPEWVLKFARVPGWKTPFDRDEQGLSLAALSGNGVAAHAPSLIGRFEACGLHASVETAAVGETLTRYLTRVGDRGAKVRAVAAVADWVIEMGATSRRSSAALEPERQRLTADVLPRWPGERVPADLVETIQKIDGVLQHNDLGCWNIMRNKATFTVLDWESAREVGFPLWDLLYFLTDALTHLDGEWGSPEDRDAYARRLFRGEARSSPLLFDWIAKGARAAGVELADVGPVATLCWLHHGSSYDERSAAAATFAPDLPTPPAVARRVAMLWLADPELSPRWDALRRWCGVG